MANRKEKASETHAKIIEAAKKLMSHGSLNSVKVEDITAEAGVAKGSFYVHFKSKYDVMHEIEMEILEGFAEYSITHNKTVQEQMVTYMALYFKMVVELSRDLYCNIMRSELEESRVSLVQKNKAEMKKILLLHGYEDNDTMTLTIDCLTSYIHGAALEWGITEGEKDPYKTLDFFGDEMVRLLLGKLTVKARD